MWLKLFVINFLEPKRDGSNFTDFNQTQSYGGMNSGYNQNNQFNNFSNQGYNNQQNNYNQNNFGRNQNQPSYNEFDQRQPESSSSPFEELSSDNFDVSDDDLPF